MTAEQISLAIEPFYTTKPEGQGTGLGLSMVYGFAKQSGGHLKLYSEPGHGATVRLYIPRTSDAAAPADALREPPAPGQGEIVLLVEDDPLIRVVTAAMLRDLGYQVVEAEVAEAALALLDGVALMITDLGLGKMDGLALAAAARARLPFLPVIIASGQAALDTGLDGLVWLHKPFDSAALRAALDQVQLWGERPPPVPRPAVKA
jgi:CheY-like chemotaxis protein